MSRLRFDLRSPVRSADADLFDAFFVSAVATLLVIRIFLEATGYPRLGGNGLHVAHVLWGGLGMVLSIVLLLLYLSPTTRLVAAIVGGAGFGAFIDELGKFLTADNNYFFKPTASLVYVLFVVLFLVTRQVRLFRTLSPEENLVNAVELSEKLVMGDLSDAERERALQMLALSDQADPMVPALRERFLAARGQPTETSFVRRLGATARARYQRIAGSRWFRRAIAGFFILWAIGFLLSVTATLAMLAGASLGIPGAQTALLEATEGSAITSWIEIVATAVGGAFVVLGVVEIRRSRMSAYRAFELAVLVELLLVEPFAFLDEGFAAAADVLIDLALLAMLRYLRDEERTMAATTQPLAALAERAG